MRNGLLIMIRMGGLCTFALLSLCGVGQSVPNPKVQTPNVASLDKFEDIPVDMATGTPGISIPIHTLHYGNISVPISLRYHPAGLRTTQHPGWVGLGWDLESGGSITRVVRGAPDEFNGLLPVNTSPDGYYPIAGFSNPGSQIINNSNNWYTTGKLDTIFSGIDPLGESMEDVSADEFTFNFMGHSGKFYYEGTTLGWQVASDENIQVQMNSTPFLTGDQVVATVANEFATGNRLFVNETNVPQENSTEVFSGFVLTVPDGTKYYFGGVNASGNGIGIEFYCPYAQNGVTFNTNTWLLTKIVDVDGNEVDFNYSASYAVTDLGIGFSVTEENCKGITGGFLGGVGNTSYSFPIQINMDILQGMMSLPLYLDNITCHNETVSFRRTVSNTCLRLPDSAYRYNPFNQRSVTFGVMNLLGDGVTVGGVTINGPSNLQWMQLDTIQITNGNGPAGTNGAYGIGQVYRNYLFNYSNAYNQRLTLLNFQELDNGWNSISKYSFAYNNYISNLPSYTGDSTDHYGFYNGFTVKAVIPGNFDGTTGSIYQAKQPSFYYAQTGLLSQIAYPTGGTVSLIWGGHDYSNIVDTVRQNALINQTGNASCCRIAEIQSYLADGTLAHDKKYFYVRGYTNAHPTGLPSSGILNGIPTYLMNLGTRMGINQEIDETIQVISLNSLAVYGYNSEGSYIGYDQVVELNEDNSYTINYFTSYGPDLNGISHYDVYPVGSTGWVAGDHYFPYTEMDLERGKLIATMKYTPSDMLVEKTVNTYRSDAARFNNALRLVNFNNSWSGCSLVDALVLSSAYYKYTYDYYVVSKADTLYDQNGKNPQAATTGYQYNANNLVSVKTETNSRGETIQTTYKYPPDMTDATSVAMTAAHILNPVMQTAVTDNGLPVTTTTTNYYSPQAGMYKPQTVQVQVASNPVETRQSFYNYDSQGNINELSKTNDIHEVYLWGYFRQYPVAKITGATLSQVTGYVRQGQIDTLTNTASPTSDASVQLLLQGIRTNLPGVLVTTYTYLPVSGITSETDPRAFLTKYSYDNFQRLQMITDNDGNVLKTFAYQYQTP